jgi:hypothetical protein
LPEIVKKVFEFLEGKRRFISDFDWELVSFKYVVEKTESGEMVLHEEESVPGILSTVAIILKLVDKTVSDKENTKLGLMVFTVKSDEVYTDDNIKGEDSKIYAFTDLGLSSYFSDIRTSKVNI